VDLVVPVKPLSAAKSRLRGAADGGLGEPSAHARLTLALAHDTVAAARAATRVRRLVVVSSDPVVAAELGAVGIEVVPDGPMPGLNAAYEHGAAVLRRRDAAAAVGALQADLPALRPAELAVALDAAAEFDQSFVPDALDVGTTFYGVRPGMPFRPRFGGESRARHLAAGAKELCVPGIDSVRRDVDTPDDLRAAIVLGLGPHTAAVVAELWPPG
jgi:2-phospho-L-lactate/phosphoenolpyruvate guanylyltransferase